MVIIIDGMLLRKEINVSILFDFKYTDYLDAYYKKGCQV
jgi:hypothetical protein